MSELERSQVESQYRLAQAAVPSLERQVAQQENLLSVLLGRNPGAIPRGRPVETLLDPVIPAALPSTLLERRPDVLQAEQNLRAANADIGAAKALYFPSLSLTGIFGLQSTSLDNFSKSSSTTGGIVATITGPIFTFGAIEGQVAGAEAGQRGALAFYEQVVFNAFRETNDALVGVQKRREEYEALAKRAQALRTYARLSRREVRGRRVGLPRGAVRRERAVRRRAERDQHARPAPRRAGQPLQGARRRLGRRRRPARAAAALIHSVHALTGRVIQLKRMASSRSSTVTKIAIHAARCVSTP